MALLVHAPGLRIDAPILLSIGNNVVLLPAINSSKDEERRDAVGAPDANVVDDVRLEAKWEATNSTE